LNRTCDWVIGTDTSRGAAPGRVHVLESDKNGIFRTVCVARDEATANTIVLAREKSMEVAGHKDLLHKIV